MRLVIYELPRTAHARTPLVPSGSSLATFFGELYAAMRKFHLQVCAGTYVRFTGRKRGQKPETQARKNIKNGKSKCCLHIFGQMFAVENDPFSGLLSCGCSAPSAPSPSNKIESILISHYLPVIPAASFRILQY